MPEPTAQAYGVGARVTIHPMADNFADIILGALDDAAPARGDLETCTSQVRTYAGGDERTLVTWLTTLIGAAARRAEGAHVGVHVLLSRGCPGEVACELPGGQPWARASELDAPTTGIVAAAEWSLYPLVDGGAQADHMAPIMAAIQQAKRSGLFDGSDHYVTRLRGDVGAILALVASAWLATGGGVQHVVTHLSLSINSPTDPSRSNA